LLALILAILFITIGFTSARPRVSSWTIFPATINFEQQVSQVTVDPVEAGQAR